MWKSEKKFYRDKGDEGDKRTKEMFRVSEIPFIPFIPVKISFGGRILRKITHGGEAGQDV
jgi:hypothetical protein